jgi:hypothetical protein
MNPDQENPQDRPEEEAPANPASGEQSAPEDPRADPGAAPSASQSSFSPKPWWVSIFQDKKARIATFATLTISILGLLADAEQIAGRFLQGHAEEQAAIEAETEQQRAIESVKRVVRGHYEAIEAGNYQAAYRYFGGVMRNAMGAEEWIEAQKEFCPVDHPDGVEINSVRVSTIDEDDATVTADVGFYHTCEGAWSHWVFAWELEKELDGWKLASQVEGGTQEIHNSVPLPSDNTGQKESTVKGDDATPQLTSITASATAEPGQDYSGKWHTYEPANVVDEQRDTAWQVAGTGKDEWLLLEYEEPVAVSRIGLIPGYWKTDPKADVDRFYQMYVVEEARFEFSDGTSEVKTFERFPKMQFREVRDTKTSYVRVRILDTYPPQPRHPDGSYYADLLGKAAISEIQVE